MRLVCVEEGEVGAFVRLVSRLGCSCRVVCSGGVCRVYLEYVPSSLRVLKGFAAWIGYLLGRCRPVVPVPAASLPGLPGLLGAVHVSDGGDVCFERVGGGSVCLPVDVFWSHMGVFGSTGSGKSTTTAYVVSRLASCGVVGVVFDWHGEYRGLLGAFGSGFYEYSYPGLPRLPLLPGGDVDAAVDVFSDVLGLSDNQALLMLDLLESIRSYCLTGELRGRLGILLQLGGGPPRALDDVCRGGEGSLRGFMRLVMELYNRLYVVESRGEKEAWAALLRRLRMALREPGLFSLEAGSLEDVVQLPSEGIVVFNLSRIRSGRSRALYALLLGRLLYEEAYRTNRLMNTVLVFEEAHNLNPRRGGMTGGVLSRLAEEARKYRLGIIVVDQSPGLLDKSLLANLNTVIMHRVHSSRDLEALKSVAPSSRELEKTLPTLRTGEAILASTALPAPVPIIIRAR